MTSDIKEYLFSFKTFRSPNRIGEGDKRTLFIQHPNFSNSVFNQCPVKGVSTQSNYTTFMNQLNPATSYNALKSSHSSFYDFSCQLMRQRINDSSKEEWLQNNPNALSNSDYFSVWEELLKQLATRKSKTARQACLQMIVAQHYLTHSQSLSLSDVPNLVVVIPEKVTIFISTWQHDFNEEDLYGVYNLGIQDYRRVEQTLSCYVPGEVSHVENIMAREYKEKSSRNTLRTEETTELSSESTTENTNDTTTTERNEVSSEIAKIIQKDRSFNVSGSVTVSKDIPFLGSLSANVGTGYNSSNASSQSNTEAKNYAKEITERAVERIEQKVAERRTYKIIKEYEEFFKHGYDNRVSDRHVTGVYRWVDKIYQNQLVNYGKRLVLEMEVPHPAKLYKMALKWKKTHAGESSIETESPKSLLDFGIDNAQAITESNASKVDEAAAYYGVSIDWPTLHKIKTFALTYNNLGYPGQTVNTEVHTEYLDENYKCNKITGSFHVNYKGNQTQNGRVVSLFYFGGSQPAGAVGYYAPGIQDMDTAFNVDYSFNPMVENSIDCYFSYQHVGSISGIFYLHCQLDERILSSWQQEIYTRFLQAYNRLKAEYDNQLALQQEILAAASDYINSEDFSREAANRLIEERELKRSCIEMLSRSFSYEMGQCFHNCEEYECENCEGNTISSIIPEIIQNANLGDQVEFVRFFETAFQWEILSYTFFPYYYNPKCAWYELMQTKNDDPIFEAFLQSGMAKVLVPVRPQFEKAVLWYLRTGDIFPDADLVPETEDDQNLSLLRELQSQEEAKVEGVWETRVPSTLTIIQTKSAYLDNVEAFPCHFEYEDSPFVSGDHVLLGLDNPDNPE